VNHLDAHCSVPGGNPADIAAEVKSAAGSLRAIAARHLPAGA